MANSTIDGLTAISTPVVGTDLLIIERPTDRATKVAVTDFFTSSTFVTPALGVAAATSINKVAITAPAASATLTIANGATLTASASATVSGTNTGDQTTVSGNAGTATALATARAIYGNNFDGTVDLTQVIASTFGGTGNGFFKVSGPASTEKTLTIPNASNTITAAAFTVLDDANVGAMVDTIGGASATGTGGLARSTSPRFTTEISPATDDAAALGTTALGWADLFIATGGVINYANGNVVLTHSSGILTMGTGEMRITTIGTNTASVVSVGGTQTLTGKTLTAPKIASAGFIADANGNELIIFTTTASAVNEITFANAATTTAPTLTTTGGDSVIDLTITPKGTNGAVAFTGPIKLTGSPATDGTFSGPSTRSFNSGYSSTAVGDLVILDSSATWQKCDANTAAIYSGLIGIAMEVSASAAACLVALPGSFIHATAFPTMTIGATMYMSETAAAITATQPSTTDAAIRIVGYAVHADKIYFYPEPGYITHT